jgi:cytochrome c553
MRSRGGSQTRPMPAERVAPARAVARSRSALAGGLAPVFMLVLLLLLCTAGAHAAPPFENTIAQRVQACTGCHGPEGRAAPDGYYPRIAGKPAGYLYNQLLNFRDGRRHYALMNGLLAPLDDAYLREIAEHFAGLDVAYPPPQRTAADAAVIERGRRLVAEGDAARRIPACVQCHGESMMGVAPWIPGLLGIPRDYLNAQLGAWKGGSRHALPPDCMAQVAAALTPEDISAVASWLAAQPAGGKPAAALDHALPIACGGVPGGAR